MRATLILLLFILSCTTETHTGIEYYSKLDVSAYVEIHQDGALLESFCILPFQIKYVELPPGCIETKYTPCGCRTITEVVILAEGNILEDSLWKKIPLRRFRRFQNDCK